MSKYIKTFESYSEEVTEQIDSILNNSTVREGNILEPMLYSVEKQDLSKLQTLLETSSSDLVNHIIYGTTLLIEACNTGNLEIVQLLVKYGADINKFGKALYNPISKLAQLAHKKENHLNVLKYLLELPGIDVNIKTLVDTPLDIAISQLKYKRGINISQSIIYLKTIKILLEHGADPYLKNKNGLNAFEFASRGKENFGYETKYNDEILNILNEYKK